ncbi:MAG: MBL fold metallo-hydrolase [Gammaproteobacteria bacterium]|nr:MBL fold metallo-hydrolase [Gammaproteobacteria bacterium]
MKIRFHGVRGSIPSPGAHTVRYGGNTTCIEVRSDTNDLIILDAGTGIFPFSHKLLPEVPLTANIFISHTHWDHIQGLPFFTPVFIPGNTVNIHGPQDPITQRELSEVLSRQMEYAYFPIREAELKAKLNYISLKERQTVAIGSARITNILMNHPVINFGYKVECGPKSMFFTGDHEWPINIYKPEDDYYNEFEVHIAQQRCAIIDFIRGTDVLITDTAYTEKEYTAKKGWGHGTFRSSILLAREAMVKRCYFTHHEPTRSDEALESAFAKALAENGVGKGDPEFFLAREGEAFDW